MSTQGTQNQNQTRTALQNILKFKEEWEMNVVTQIRKVKGAISRGLVTQHPVKLVGVIALGATMLTVTGLHFTPSPPVESNPGSRERVVVPEANQDGMSYLRRMDDFHYNSVEKLDEFDEWAMVLDQTPRATSAAVDLADKEAEEFEEWGMALHPAFGTTSAAVDSADGYVEEFEEWGMVR